MDVLTVVFIVVGIVVTLGITAFSLMGARKMVSGMLSPLLAQQAETKRLLAVGVPCAARVLHIEQTGTSMAVMGEQSYELRFRLEVTPPAAAAYRGASAPYQAEMVSLVPMLAVPRVQPGCVITVRVDPQDPRKMVFEGASPPMQAPVYPGGPVGYPGASPAAPMGGYGVPQAGTGAGMPGQGAPGYGAAQGGYGAPQAGYGPHAGWTQR